MNAPIITYSLAEVAAAVLSEGLADPERWLTSRINRGQIPAYRAGRTWRMTDADVAAFIEFQRNTLKPRPKPAPAAAPAVEPAVGEATVRAVTGLSARSARQRNVRKAAAS